MSAATPASSQPQVSLAVHLGLMATMAVWAANVSAVKWLTSVTDVALVAALRMVFAAVVLFGLLLYARQQFPYWRGRTLALGLGCALLMVYANQMLFAGAMHNTTASNAALILSLNPLLNGVLEALVFGKRLTRRFIGGALLAVCGVLMVVLNGANKAFAGPSIGDLLVVASMFAFAAGGLAMQRLSHQYQPLAINTFVYIVGALALLLHALVTLPDAVQGLASIDWRAWCVVMFSGVFATALGGVGWARGVAAMGMGKAAIYMSWVPVMGVGFGALLLGEELTIWHFFGMILVLSGTILSSMRTTYVDPTDNG